MKYRTFDLVATSHGKEQILVRSRKSGTRRLLSRPQALLLLRCDTFRTLSDHAAQNWLLSAALENAAEADENARVEMSPMTAVQRSLTSLVQDGFLVSDADVHHEIRELCLAPSNGEALDNKITSLGIPTQDRPESLNRALTGYFENAARSARAFDITVMDDSRNASTQLLNQNVLNGLQRRCGARLRYAAFEHRARFGEELAARAGISKDIVRFALLGDDRFGKSYGASRNALLLDSVGEMMVQADDDTVCSIHAPPYLEEGLMLTSSRDANELSFYESFEDALAAVSPVDADFAGLHERLLGRSPAACIAQSEAAGEDLDFSTIGSEFLDRMHQPDAGVGVTFAGIVGDSGAPYQYRFLHGGRSIDRLIQSEQAYRMGVSTRQMVKAASRLTISNGVFCMTASMGFDHRTLLPPFVPVLRNEDGVFGGVLSTCFPGHFSGFIPYAVPHLPPEARSLDSDPGRERYKTFLANGVLMWIIMSFKEHMVVLDAPRNLRSLGRHLQDLGELPAIGFAEFLRTIAGRTISANIAHAERELEKRQGAPSYWAEDVKAYIEATAAAVVQPEFAIPSDLEGSAAERLVLFQELLHRFGTLLVCWPDIVAAARELRAVGRRISAASATVMPSSALR